ncbi:MAG: MotA/TolQ/ExbB proton channel family protein [Flavobacteriaceae bacterium]
MLDFFFQGGPLFMGLLTLVLAAIIFSVFGFKTHTKMLGQLGLGLGILASLIGLYSAFESIEKSGGVSQAVLAGGLKNALTPTLYGVFVYLVSLLIQFRRL